MVTVSTSLVGKNLGGFPSQAGVAAISLSVFAKNGGCVLVDDRIICVKGDGCAYQLFAMLRRIRLCS